MAYASWVAPIFLQKEFFLFLPEELEIQSIKLGNGQNAMVVLPCSCLFIFLWTLSHTASVFSQKSDTSCKYIHGKNVHRFSSWTTIWDALKLTVSEFCLCSGRTTHNIDMLTSRCLWVIQVERGIYIYLRVFQILMVLQSSRVEKFPTVNKESDKRMDYKQDPRE